MRSGQRSSSQLSAGSGLTAGRPSTRFGCSPLQWRAKSGETVMRTQFEKGRLFQELHQRQGILILPNPWDAGTAKLLASVGFDALATTSLGMSNALGRVDGEGSVSRAELLENCRIIAEATDLPVNADLENGYADDPKEAA